MRPRLKRALWWIEHGVLGAVMAYCTVGMVWQAAAWTWSRIAPLFG